jgi:hypothetical protein
MMSSFFEWNPSDSDGRQMVRHLECQTEGE